MEAKTKKKYIVKTITDKRTGKRIYFRGKTQRELNQKLLDYKAKEERGRLFTEVSDEWWAEKEPKLAEQSVRGYKLAKKRADVEFNNTPINSITPIEINNLLKKLVAKNYGYKTIAKQRLIINLIFQFALFNCDVKYNPCVSVSVPDNLPKVKRTSASDIDEKTIRDSADVWIFPYIALMTGMRKGEILALQWKDIDFNNNIINITKSVAHENNKPFIKDTKTQSGMRKAPLLKDLKNELLKLYKGKNDDYIISINGKDPLTEKRYTNMMKRYRKKTNTNFVAHQLRHSFATKAFECGVPVKSVQNILGHKQINTTMDIYTDFRDKALKEAAFKLNKKGNKITKSCTDVANELKTIENT